MEIARFFFKKNNKNLLNHAAKIPQKLNVEVGGKKL